ncbi:MAG: OadG family protein [Cyclobacteriaceae bacterium]|jgi:Flp pilus assembly protein TadB|nr:OadG family protein [Cyclobacteriaceae bacterium]
MNLLGEVVFDLSRITSEYTTLAFVGYVIVFVALITLYFVFQYIPVLLTFITKRELKRKLKKKGLQEEVIDDITITGEVGAAISTALHLFFNEMHDDEKTVLTIRKISKSYSPWSSKIYNVTKGLNRRF